MPKLSLREKLNGNYGFVITSGMVVFIIGVIGFLANATVRLDARIDDRSSIQAEKCINEYKKENEPVIRAIQNSQAKNDSDHSWIKEVLNEIKCDIKDLKNK